MTTSPPFATERAIWYTRSEDGVVCPNARHHSSTGPAKRPGPDSPITLEIGHAVEHSLRCVCAGCLEERATIRNAANAEMTATSPAKTWARRSWDGPLANFPGTTHDDTAAPRRVRRHKSDQPRNSTAT